MSNGSKPSNSRVLKRFRASKITPPQRYPGYPTNLRFQIFARCLTVIGDPPLTSWLPVDTVCWLYRLIQVSLSSLRSVSRFPGEEPSDKSSCATRQTPAENWILAPLMTVKNTVIPRLLLQINLDSRNRVPWESHSLSLMQVRIDPAPLSARHFLPIFLMKSSD